MATDGARRGQGVLEGDRLPLPRGRSFVCDLLVHMLGGHMLGGYRLCGHSLRGGRRLCGHRLRIWPKPAQWDGFLRLGGNVHTEELGGWARLARPLLAV